MAAQWTMILTDEFARQASMEQDLGIPSALFAAPVRETIELGKSQIGFMNMFAIPLFQGVTDVMPAMKFCVDELQRNKVAWEEKIAEEQARRRQDSDDSGMTDGMFSPRTMSVANPSDVSHQKLGSISSLSPDMDLRKALLAKSPFSPKNGTLDESTEFPHHSSLPELSTGPTILDPEESLHPSPNESLGDAGSRRSSKPSQLQLSYATASAPGLLDNPSLDPEAKPLINGEPEFKVVTVEPSLVTDPVIVDPQVATAGKAKSHASDKQRSSDTTESSTSAGDWASQATSATTGKMPLSPSTQGTSIMSEESEDKSTPTAQSAIGSPHHSHTSTTNSRDEGLNNNGSHPDQKELWVKEKPRNLKKKPSRFRMNSLNFWKRNKSSSPPVPSVNMHHTQSQDEVR